MTTLNFLLAHAVARTLKPGDEIIVTQLDHDGNVSPWLRVADDHELTVHTVPVRPRRRARSTSTRSRRCCRDRTRIVAFTLASNAVGSKPDARRIADLAHAVGALAWADAVHYAPHGRIDRDALGPRRACVCSPYKFFGPHLGMAAIRHDLAERWPADRVRPADETPAGPPLRDRHAVARGAGRLRRRRRLPGRAGRGRHAAASGSTRAFARIAAHEESLSLRHAATRLTAIPASACTASPTRPGSASARRRSPSPSPAPRRATSPRSWAARASSCGTATTTPSAPCSRSASRSTAAPSAPASCTTRRWTRSTASATSLAAIAARG